MPGIRRSGRAHSWRCLSKEELAMTDDLKNRGAQERARISLEQEHEDRY
jgi:hypothetical protein